MLHRINCVLGVLLLTSADAYASWSAGIRAGTQLGSESSPTLGIHLQKQNLPLSHHLYLDWVQEPTGSRYRLGYDPNFNISQSVYSFARFSIEQDDPGGVAREINARAGIGNHIFRTKKNQFTLRTGIGGTQLRLTDATDMAGGYVFASGLVTSEFFELLAIDAKLDSSFAESRITTSVEAGISFRVTPGTALKYAYSFKRYDFDSDIENIVIKGSFISITHSIKP